MTYQTQGLTVTFLANAKPNTWATLKNEHAPSESAKCELHTYK